MDEKEVFETIKTTIDEVKNLLGLESSALIRLLLNNFRWDRQTLIDRYFEDSNRIMRQFKLPKTVSRKTSGALVLSKENVTKKRLICPSCYEEKDVKHFDFLTCGHYQCRDCWRFYLQANIQVTTGVQKIFCPSMCSELIDDEDVLQMIADMKNVKMIFERNLICNFVDTYRLVKYCPGTDCRTIIRLGSSMVDFARSITCDSCRQEFCFECLQDWHDPVQCSMLKKWQKKIVDESMTSQWLVSNTRECPKCKTNIEKNGGCNHMTCGKVGCSFEFCWLCLELWSTHQTRQCNVFRHTQTEKNKSKTRENLDRYVHYASRYQAHNRSLELESHLSSQTALNIDDHTIPGTGYRCKQLMTRSLSVLLACRRTLKYTYAFAFYLYQNNQAQVFEQNQADLERATEALSHDLEDKKTWDAEFTKTLVNKTDYCDIRRSKLLQHCREGYMEHYWAGLDPY